MERPQTNLNDLLRQKERALAAMEKDAIELRKQIEALRQTIDLLSESTGYEKYLASSQVKSPADLSVHEDQVLIAQPDESQAQQHGAITEAIIRTLTSDQGKTVEEVFNSIKASSSTQVTRDSIAKTLSRLRARGRVKKIGFATYCLA